MALTHLLDTSVLTRLREPAVRAAIEPRAHRGELARAGISDLEIGFSARNTAEWDRLTDAVEAFELLETAADTFVVRGKRSGCSRPNTSAGASCPTCSSPPRPRLAA